MTSTTKLILIVISFILILYASLSSGKIKINPIFILLFVVCIIDYFKTRAVEKSEAQKK